MVGFVNNVKTAVLLAALFGLLVFIGGAVAGKQGLILAGVIATVMNFGAWFFSDRIAIASMRGREVDPNTPGGRQLHEMVGRLSRQAGIPAPRIYICPQDAPNAFATGRNPRHAAVAFTKGILRLLDYNELEGVAAHELAHIRNRDTLTSTVAATVAGIFSMMAQWFFFFGGGLRREGTNPLVALGMVLLGMVGAALIKSMISRSREFVADADGAAIAGSPDGLASALRKLEATARRVPMHQPNPAMNNLFIVEPFMGRGLTELFASHPPTERRIRALLGGRG
ncbi:MAG: M48 family metalloprotease [Planctomycetota bacterium]|jgi:heat shock protein HtpX